MENLAIVITTKNREQDLERTLLKLKDIGIDLSKVYVVDDGSQPPIGRNLMKLFQEINLLRNDISKGLITNRNSLHYMTNADYLLSLDDDSNPLSLGDLEKAIDILNLREEYACFAFRIVESTEFIRPDSIDEKIKYSRNFTGCGYLMKASCLNGLKYMEELEFYCEEIDLSLKLFKEGKRVVTRDDLFIHHRVDWAMRNRQFEENLKVGEPGSIYRSRLGFRNNLLIVWMYYPFVIREMFFVYLVLRRFYEFRLRKNDKTFFQGLRDFSSFTEFQGKGRRLNYLEFFRWFCKLP